MQDPTSLRDGSKALVTLRERILRLDLSPGSVLDENALASLLSLSRTPVREAIIQLISEGLAIRDGRFARVAPLNLDEIPQLYEALLVSSRMVSRLAAEHRSPDDLKDIRETQAAFDRSMYGGGDLQRQDANVAFHMAIARAAHNIYFLEFYQRTLTASSRLSRACFAGAGKTAGNVGPVSKRSDPALHAHLTEVSRQHALMVDAIADGNIEEADRIAVLHQDLARDRINTLMFSLSTASTSLNLPRLKLSA